MYTAVQIRVARTGNLLVEDASRKRVAVLSPNGEILFLTKDSGWTRSKVLLAVKQGRWL